MLTMDDVKNVSVRFACGFDCVVTLTDGRTCRGLDDDQMCSIITHIAKEKITQDDYIKREGLLNHFIKKEGVAAPSTVLNQLFKK